MRRMDWRAVRAAVRLALMLGVVAASLFGQALNVGSLRGTITDSASAVIVGAEITVQHDASGVATKALSNQVGTYTLLNLPVGTYTLTISYAGFQTARRDDLRMVSGITLVQDVQLQLGDITQTVEVTATAAIDVTTSTAGNSRTLEEIRELPLQLAGQYRNSNQFVLNLPGFNLRPSNPSTSTGGGVEDVGRGSHMGAGSGFANNFVGYNIDGVSGAAGLTPSIEDNGQLIPDAVEEFRYATNFNAEYGGNLGTAMILVTKSGTNEFHGNVFEYFRNNRLDARNFFDTLGKPSPNKQNEYGFTVGGPIVRDKLFFFGSWDGFKYRRAAGGTTGSVPTDLMRGGDFSEWLGPQVGTDAASRPVLQGQIFDPLTNRPDGQGGIIRDPFLNNALPQDRLSSISVFLQEAGYPRANQPGLQNNWAGLSIPRTLDVNRFSGKIDSAGWANHRLSFGFDLMPAKDQTGDTLTPVTWQIGNHNRRDVQWRFRLVDNWTPSPNLVVSFRAAWNRYKYIGVTPEPSASLGCTAGLTGTLACGTPWTSIEAVAGLGWLWNHYYRFWTALPVNLDASVQKGNHSIKFGTQFRQQVVGNSFTLFSSGQFNFRSLETGMPGVASTGIGYASFLLGEVGSSAMQTPKAQTYTARSYAFFIQDEWRMTPKLTLSYGLRWSISDPISEVHDRIGTFDPNLTNPATGTAGALTFWGQGPGRNGRRFSFDRYGKAFSPRFGLAYAINPKTVFRGYYGLLYAPILGDFVGGEFIDNFGWGATVSTASQDAGVTSAFNWNDGFPPIVPTFPNLNPAQLNGSGLTHMNPLDNRPARSQNVGLAIDHELGGGISIKGEYVAKWIHGLKSWGSPYTPQLNELPVQQLALGSLLQSNINSEAARDAGIPIPFPGFEGTVAQALRPFPQYQGIGSVGSRSQYSLYNAFLFTAQKRFSQGLSFLVGYTVAKHFENAGVQHRSMLDTGKQLMVYDRPKILALSYIYELPFGPGKRFLSDASGFLKQLVGGWQIAGSHNYYTGVPVRVSTRGSLPGIGGVWANRVPDVPIRTSVGCGDYQPADPSQRYLNIGAFSTPAPFTFGNTRTLPNTRDCGYYNENIAVLKDFPLTERVRLRLGGEFFNLFNRHAWGGMVTDINNPGLFGRFTSATDPRTVQFHLKVTF